MKNKKKKSADTVLTPERKKQKKLAAAILISVCVLALVGKFFLDAGYISFEDNASSSVAGNDDIVIKPVLRHPDWETNIFELEEYLEKNRYLTYTQSGYSIMITDEDYAAFEKPVELFASYFDALMHGDAEKVNSFYSDSYFEDHEPFEKLSMQKLYDMGIEILGIVDSEMDGRAVTNYYYKVTYKIMANDGLFRDDLISDAERPQYYTVTDFGNEFKITGVGYEIPF